MKEVVNYPDYYITVYGDVFKKSNGKQVKAHLTRDGYLRLTLKGKKHLVHNLVFETYEKIKDPNLVVDHIDNNKLNNHPSNLQEITNRENCSKDKKGGSSNYIGVCYDKISKKWKAQIKINNKAKTIGRFNSQLEAAIAYKKVLNKIKK